jgi:hypothetical protein
MVNKNEGNQTNMNRTLKAIVLSAGLCSLPNLCFSAIVYDNSATDLGQYYPTNFEYGDQITLAGTDRTLSQFTFSYFFSGATASTQSWTLRMYANAGTNTPVAPFYTSDPIPVATGVNGYNTPIINFDLASPAVILPNTFTWTVQFSNLAPGQNAGLLLYGPPNVGSSFNDFWQKDGTGTWSLHQINNGSPLADFAARVSAVPEPGVLALGGLGALLLAGLGRFRKPPR